MELNMIRLLCEQDYDIVKSYLEQDPLNNLHPIHGLQRYGIAGKRVTFWGGFDGNQLGGVLFVDNTNNSLWSFLSCDNQMLLLDLVKVARKSDIKAVIGKQSSLQPAIKKLRSRHHISVNSYLFYKSHPDQYIRHYDYPVRAVTNEDIPLLVDLYRGYEFSSKNRGEEEIELEIRKTMDESGSYFFIEMEGRAVSVSRVYAETDKAGMLGASRTLPEFRGRGLISSVRTACQEYLFNQGKIGVAFVIDTNIGNIKSLKKEAVSVIGKWLIINFSKRPPLRHRILPLSIRRRLLSLKDILSPFKI